MSRINWKPTSRRIDQASYIIEFTRAGGLYFLSSKKSSPLIIIDEIQKLPGLLDEVHNQIELNKKLRFILTGSSARKLKRSGANLLGGRASCRTMFPFTARELGGKLKTLADLERRLLIGALPSVFDSSNPRDDLEDYIQLYLNEEMKAEGFVRNYEGFHRFLLTAALTNGKQVNFTEMGSDSQIPPRTVHDYFQVLEDTLIGNMLSPFLKTPSRKAVSSSKFYLFDTGLVNALLKRQKLTIGTPEFGDLFEHFIVSEVKAHLSYAGKKSSLFYWRSTSQFEVELISKVHRKKKKWPIEIKEKNNISSKDTRGLLAYSQDYPNAKKIIVHLEGRHSIDENGVEIIPVFDFLKMLWADEFGFE